MKSTKLLLIAASVLWLIWGLVHILAGVVTMLQVLQGDTTAAVHGITDKVNIETLRLDYPYAVGAIIKQHGWNLLWVGVVTAVGAVFVWRQNTIAIFVNAATGGLADLGYFIFIDVPGLANPPGPQMTWICSAAILCSLYAWFKGLRGAKAA